MLANPKERKVWYTAGTGTAAVLSRLSAAPAWVLPLMLLLLFLGGVVSLFEIAGAPLALDPWKAISRESSLPP